MMVQAEQADKETSLYAAMNLQTVGTGTYSAGTYSTLPSPAAKSPSQSSSRTRVGGAVCATSERVPVREKVCLVCGQSLFKAEFGCLETPEGAAFHIEHMFCTHCNTPLAEKACCFTPEGKLLCERHFIELNRPDCDLCNKPIVYTGIPLSQRILMPSVDANSAKVGASAFKGAFAEGLPAGTTLTVLNYHTRCLKCSNIKCRGMYLPGWQAVKLGTQFHCEQDALEAQQPKCFFCKFYIHPNDRYTFVLYP